jgi:hypothetical protein
MSWWTLQFQHKGNHDEKGKGIGCTYLSVASLVIMVLVKLNMFGNGFRSKPSAVTAVAYYVGVEDDRSRTAPRKAYLPMQKFCVLSFDMSGMPNWQTIPGPRHFPTMTESKDSKRRSCESTVDRKGSKGQPPLVNTLRKDGMTA